ncbi:hypothetical protein [Wolbachia endosymbiont of Litomosoides sigmodontis]|nr:hypothetical protein [Wolbachia endosymbiont of Litomosoides sigmodontis]
MNEAYITNKLNAVIVAKKYSITVIAKVCSILRIALNTLQSCLIAE